MQSGERIQHSDSAFVGGSGGGAVEVPELNIPANGQGVQSSLGSSVAKSTSSRIKQVSQRLAFLTRRPKPPARALTGLRFISKTGSSAWTEVADRFDDLTRTTNGMLPRALFGKCIGMKESTQFEGELFDALARRRHISGDSIGKDQLKDFWEQITNQDFDRRLQTFLDMVDKDADGRLTEDEIKEIISLSASANKLSDIQENADKYARLVMEHLDPDNLGYIMIHKLEMLLLQGAEQSGCGESRNLSKMLSEKQRPTVELVLQRWYSGGWYFVADNWQRVWVMAVWMGVMAALFAYKYVQYKNKAAFEVMGHCVCAAKGAAETLKLNMALILLPMCRNTITWLRNRTRLGAVVPFDDNINFHMIVATAIGIGVGIHGISHLACDFPRLLHASPEKYEKMAPYFGNDQPKSYWHYVKGFEGVSGILIVVLMAIAFTLASPMFRRNRVHLPKPLDKLAGFNAFWYSHHLFIVVYALLIAHGIKLYLTHDWYNKTTWMYVAIPITMYAAERLIRAFRSGIKPVTITKVGFPPGKVLTLHMSKPEGFRYKSGQYIFVNCSAVSPFEWHPFSITSAPRDNYLSVHIRAIGDWTKKIEDVFSKVCKPPPTEKSGPPRAYILHDVENNPNIPKVRIDGPYGAPTQVYKDYDIVLLIGLGIGATPMISVIKDIIYNIKAIEDDGNAIEEGGGDGSTGRMPLSPMPKHDFKTRRAYFYWMTREQGSFDWFKGVMNEIAEMDDKRVIEMHNYCTSVHEEGDARSALISMLQSINHDKNGVDIVAGTRFKTHFARPNWEEVYDRIAHNHPNSTVGVFYCGNAAPVAELRKLAHDFSHNTKTKTQTKTKFEFHKENF